MILKYHIYNICNINNQYLKSYYFENKIVYLFLSFICSLDSSIGLVVLTRKNVIPAGSGEHF
jgi:hypothetical protein